MIALSRNKSQQKALFHIIHEDDIYLLNTTDAEWFQVLYYLPWEKYLEHAVAYYNALYEFNGSSPGSERKRRCGRRRGRVQRRSKAEIALFASNNAGGSEIGENVLFEAEIEELPPSGVSRKA